MRVNCLNSILILNRPRNTGLTGLILDYRLIVSLEIHMKMSKEILFRVDMYINVSSLFTSNFRNKQRLLLFYFYLFIYLFLHFFCILYKKKVFKSWKFSTSGFTIFTKCLSVGMCVKNFVAVLPQKLMHKIMYLVASLHKLVLIRFWCTLFKKFRFSKF